MQKKVRSKRWNDKEIILLNSLSYKGLCYDDLLQYFPERSKRSIESKIRELNIKEGFVRPSWSKEESNLLIELYPNTKNDELPKYFNNKTKSAIYTQAKRLGLSKNYSWRIDNLSDNCKSKWDDSKSKELRVKFYELGEKETYAYFKQQYNHGKFYINNKMIALGLMESSVEKYKILDRNNPNLYNAFVVYKDILNGKAGGFQKYLKNITKQQLVLLYRYYNKLNNIEITREYFISSKLSEILSNAKIRELVKKRFDGYFDFVSQCYPNLNLKPWEMKRIDVKDGFWDNKYNRFWCIREGIKNLIKDGVIINPCESLELEYEILYNYMSSSLLYYYSKNCIDEYLYFTKDNYSNPKIYNNIRFDSFQEKYVYKTIYENITHNIYKCFKKEGFLYTNGKYNERYIPDFYINTNDKIVLIEFFGMYKPNNPSQIFKDYCEKTKRKIEYFNSLENVYFIPLFPKDLNNNFEGVREKLTSFCMSKNIDLKGGGIDE